MTILWYYIAMNKYLSSLSLAIIGTLTISSQALAAPGVVYKKRLSLPTVPTSIISQAEKSLWRLPTEKSTKLGQPVFENFTNLKTNPPVFIGEKDCSGVTYRAWSVTVDLETERKNHPTLLPYSRYYKDADGIYEQQKYLFEARTPEEVKWHIDTTKNVRYSTEPFFSCRNKDVVLEYSVRDLESERPYYAPRFLKTVNYNGFANSNSWNTGAAQIPNNYNTESVIVDGIKQYPGQLTVGYTSYQTTGDSRVMSADVKNGFHLHTLPHYRDLTQITQSDTKVIYANFYRLSDGYGVVETTYDYTVDRAAPKITYYRIRNGEARYSVVDSLPFESRSVIITYDKGVTMFSGAKTLESYYLGYPYFGKTDAYLIHGIASGHLGPEAVYQVIPSILWETDAQVYTRYMITDRITGKQQYWEATVNKQ